MIEILQTLISQQDDGTELLKAEEVARKNVVFITIIIRSPHKYRELYVFGMVEAAAA